MRWPLDARLLTAMAMTHDLQCRNLCHRSRILIAHVRLGIRRRVLLDRGKHARSRDRLTGTRSQGMAFVTSQSSRAEKSGGVVSRNDFVRMEIDLLDDLSR